MTRRRDDERTVAHAHRLMRRADREVTDPEHVARIIAKCSIARIAYMDAEGLTIVPMNFAYRFVPNGESDPILTLYFHGSHLGRKIDAIKASGNQLEVAFEMEAECGIIEGRTPCNWGEAFSSVIGNGTASIVEDMEERRDALTLLMKQQAGMDHVEFSDQQVRSVTVWKVRANHLTAKSRPAPPATRNSPRNGVMAE